VRWQWVPLILLVVLVPSCLGTGSRVRFVNSSSQTLSGLSLGAAGYQDPLDPGQSTDYFPVALGPNTFTGRRQDGTAVGTVQFDIPTPGDYAVVLSDYYQTFVTLTGFGAGGTVTVNGVVFTATAGATAPPMFSVAGTDAQDLAELNVCVADPVAGVAGVTARGAFFSSTSAAVSVTSNPLGGGTCTTSLSYTLMVSLNAE
jgi:hypothetical protein